MKKNKNFRIKRAQLRNAKRAAKEKKRNYNRVIQHTPTGAKFVKAPCPVETTKDFKHGPSLVIEYTEDGKVKNFNSWNKSNKQVMTDIAKEAQKEYHIVTNSKKERIKQILQSVNYDPTIKYTRKEKKRFARAVKNNLFSSEPIDLTTIVKRKFYNRERLKVEYLLKKGKTLTPHADIVNAALAINNSKNSINSKNSKTKSLSATEINHEKPNKRKFTYVINRVCEADINSKRTNLPYKTYDFLTDYFEAETVQSAERKAANLVKKYLKDESFAGVTLKDPEGTNFITYLTPEKVTRLAA